MRARRDARGRDTEIVRCFDSAESDELAAAAALRVLRRVDREADARGFAHQTYLRRRA